MLVQGVWSLPESQFISSLGLVLHGDEVRTEHSLVSVRGRMWGMISWSSVFQTMV